MNENEYFNERFGAFLRALSLGAIMHQTSL